MAVYIKGVKYVPGTYKKQKPKTFTLTDYYLKEWDRQVSKLKSTAGAKHEEESKMLPSICFSRKIGVGGLEIADLLAEKLKYRVVDHELIDYMADTADVNKKTIEFFDERYAGKLSELAVFLFGEKSYVMSDYVKHLFRTVQSIADIGPTIFVGRGTHLILPRDRVLAVRLICSKEYRYERLSTMLNVSRKDVEDKLNEIDKEQRVFFKKVFNKDDASPYEFDICINCDYIKEPQSVADIIYAIFMKKFASELND